METKQTAVEFLVEQLETIIFYSDEAKENIIEQAKQMEKEQIKDAFILSDTANGSDEDAEQYYNETYNITK